MSDTDRGKWDRRYAEGSYKARTYPTDLLEQWLPRLPRGRALDLACGAGRNSLFLAASGYRVHAVDISETALARARDAARERGLEIDWQTADLDHFEPDAGSYDLVLVARYVNRRLNPRISSALAGGGHLIYEHHLRTTAKVDGPADAEFRLRPNELLHVFRDLRVLSYSEDIGEDRDGRRMALARLVACKGDAGF